MHLEYLNHDFSICQIPDLTQVDLTQEYYFIGKTDQELSLVCRTQTVPANALEREDGWTAFRIHGVLDFSLIGILARISDLLAKNHIGIFAVSTYNTDYILVKAEQADAARLVLTDDGHTISWLG